MHLHLQTVLCAYLSLHGSNPTHERGGVLSEVDLIGWLESVAAYHRW